MTRAGQGNGAGTWSPGPGVRHGRPEGPGQQGDRKDAGARASGLHLTPTSAGDSATTSPRLCLLFTPRRVITAPLHRGGTELGRNPRSRRDCRVPGSPAPRPEPQHPREPAALPPGGGESERLLGAPVPRPPQVGETVRGPGRPPPSAAISSIHTPLRVPEGVLGWPPGRAAPLPGPRRRRPLAPGSGGPPPAAGSLAARRGGRRAWLSAARAPTPGPRPAGASQPRSADTCTPRGGNAQTAPVPGQAGPADARTPA